MVESLHEKIKLLFSRETSESGTFMLRACDFVMLTWRPEMFPKLSNRRQTFGREGSGDVMKRSTSSPKIAYLCMCGPQYTPWISG